MAQPAGGTTVNATDPRTARTRIKIIAAAEELFSESGWNTISLRQIAQKCGLKNTSAVQYHFGDRETLIEEIAKFRMDQMEDEREKLLDELQGEQLHEVRYILRCIFLPIVDIVANGKRIYAHFLLQYLLHKRIFMFDIYPSDNGRRPGHQLLRAHNLLLEALPHCSQEEVVRRLIMASIMILGSIAMYDSIDSPPWARNLATDDYDLLDDAARFISH
ncbi:MAG: TetR/AcrR family transcriptional regulator [Parasphingorhabdus sp.]